MFILKLLSVIFYYVIADINPNRSIWVKFPSDLILQPVLICLVVGGIVDSRSILCSLYRFFQSSGCVTWAILSSHALLRIPFQSMSIVSRSSGTKMLPLKLCAASRAYSVLRVASVLSSVWYSSRFFTPSSAATAPASMAVL